MNKLKTSNNLFRGLAAFATVATLAISASATERVGNPFTPDGADFSIFGVQGISLTNPLGASGFNTQVNTNFEFTPSIGVTYDQGNGKLKDFGIGLYSDSAKQTQSTGLMIKYNTAVTASSAVFTVEDFDIDAKATGFKNNKVEPSILIFGANNTILASAKPSDIFATMTPQGDAKNDIWDINVGKLLSNMHVNATSITGALLYADASNGEKTKSDPYLLRAVGNAQPVPEPATMCALGAGLLLLRRRKKAQA